MIERQGEQSSASQVRCCMSQFKSETGCHTAREEGTDPKRYCISEEPSSAFRLVKEER